MNCLSKNCNLAFFLFLSSSLVLFSTSLFATGTEILSRGSYNPCYTIKSSHYEFHKRHYSRLNGTNYFFEEASVYRFFKKLKDYRLDLYENVYKCTYEGDIGKRGSLGFQYCRFEKDGILDERIASYMKHSYYHNHLSDKLSYHYHSKGRYLPYTMINREEDDFWEAVDSQDSSQTKVLSERYTCERVKQVFGSFWHHLTVRIQKDPLGGFGTNTDISRELKKKFRFFTHKRSTVFSTIEENFRENWKLIKRETKPSDIEDPSLSSNLKCEKVKHDLSVHKLAHKYLNKFAQSRSAFPRLPRIEFKVLGDLGQIEYLYYEGFEESLGYNFTHARGQQKGEQVILSINELYRVTGYK